MVRGRRLTGHEGSYQNDCFQSIIMLIQHFKKRLKNFDVSPVDCTWKRFCSQFSCCNCFKKELSSQQNDRNRLGFGTWRIIEGVSGFEWLGSPRSTQGTCDNLTNHRGIRGPVMG